MSGKDLLCRNTHFKIRYFITPRTLHEYYYRAFEASIVRGGADSMMTAYNELAGVPACMNRGQRPVEARLCGDRRDGFLPECAGASFPCNSRRSPGGLPEKRL